MTAPIPHEMYLTAAFLTTLDPNWQQETDRMAWAVAQTAREKGRPDWTDSQVQAWAETAVNQIACAAQTEGWNSITPERIKAVMDRAEAAKDIH